VNIVGLDYLGHQIDITYDDSQVHVTQTSSETDALPLTLLVDGSGEQTLVTGEYNLNIIT